MSFISILSYASNVSPSSIRLNLMKLLTVDHIFNTNEQTWQFHIVRPNIILAVGFPFTELRKFPSPNFKNILRIEFY